MDSSYLFDKYVENVQEYKDHQAAFSERNNKPSPLLVDLLSKERVGVHPAQPDFELHAPGRVEQVDVGGPVAPSYQPISASA